MRVTVCKRCSAIRFAERVHLTRRQCEVADLLATGMRQREIARALVISPCTVRNHERCIRDKMGGVRSRTRAALKLREIGFGEK